MDDFKLSTPVALFIFNRPDTTAQVFATIAKIKVPKLFIVADGPRHNQSGEAEKCAAARAVIDQIDWPCDVLTNFSDVNLGCKTRVSSGLDWVFEQTEQAIILEDDCVPDFTFFRFCEELLHKYRDDERVMVISGGNFGYSNTRSLYSYFCSRYPNIGWGWASWRRAWQYYDVEMKLWPEIKQPNYLQGILNNAQTRKSFAASFEKMYQGKVDTWDAQWTFACLINSGLTIMPAVNLVSNIGFGIEATHTKDATHRLANVSKQAIKFPLKHPPFIIRDAAAEKFIEENVYYLPIRKIIPRLFQKMARVAKQKVAH